MESNPFHLNLKLIGNYKYSNFCHKFDTSSVVSDFYCCISCKKVERSNVLFHRFQFHCQNTREPETGFSIENAGNAVEYQNFSKIVRPVLTCVSMLFWESHKFKDEMWPGMDLLYSISVKMNNNNNNKNSIKEMKKV